MPLTETGTSPSCDVPVAPWRAGWTARHTAVLAVAAPIAGWTYWSLATSTGEPWRAVLATLLGAAAGLVVTSYVRAPGSSPTAAQSPCAAAPVLQLVFAGMLLRQGLELPAAPYLAVLLAGLAVVLRSTGSSTCSVTR